MKFTHSFWQPRPRKHGRSTFRPRLEYLEPRVTPAMFYDTLATAPLLTLVNGVAVQTPGTLLDPNQVDLYAIRQLQAGDQVSADVNALNGGGNPGDALRVFDSTGKQIAFQENPGGGKDAALTFNVLTNEPYYVGVSSNGDYGYDPKTPGSGSGGLASGPYTLTLTLASGAILKPELPPNFTLGTAQYISGSVDQSIAGDRVIQGTYAKGATEYYRFVVGASDSGALAATVTPTDGQAYQPRLALYNSDGQLLIQTDASKAESAVELDQNLQPGAYYLGVSAVADAAGDQSYLLATTFHSADSPFQPLPVGSGPEGMATGDFNHDGNLDLATANYDDNTVSVLLGNGNGTFQHQATYSVSDVNGNGVGPMSVATGDFNHDGNLDIVTANCSDGTVSVLLGTGDGTFQSAVTYAVGNSPEAVTVGHFSSDGNLDIVTANYADDTVSVLLGNGDGTFQPAVTYAVGNGPEGVEVGQLTSDGRLDIVVGNYNDNTVSVLLGNGDGTFQPQTTYAVGKGPEGLALGQLTGDGRLDIVVGNYDDNTVSVLLGNGDGTFQAQKTYPTGGLGNPVSIVLGDFNGHLGIAAANYYSNTVSVLLGNGDGTFRLAVAYAAGYETYGVVVGDFNHDGNLDIAASNFGDGTVTVLLGSGAGAFVSSPQQVGQTPFALATGDFNHDGAADLVVPNGGDNTVSVLLGNGDGTFQPQATYAVGQNPISVAVGDFNHDGNLDIVTANYLSDTVSVLLGLGDGAFLTQKTYAVGKEPDGVTVGDFNGDGNLDIAVADYGDDTVAVLMGNGDGTFQKAVFYQLPSNPFAIAEGDFNGHPGLVAATIDNSAVSVLLGDGQGGFSISVPYPVANYPQAVLVGDFNGHPDIVTANSGYDPTTGNYGAGSVSVLLGDGFGAFQPAVTYAVDQQANAVAMGDFTNDGRLDLVTSSYYNNTVSVLLGSGDGTFQPAVAENAGDTPHGVVVGDFNNDRNQDIAVVDLGNNSVSVLLGSGGTPFQPPATYAAGGTPQAVAVAYDNVGDDIFFTANPDQGTVSVLVGNPNGTAFAPAATYAVGTDPVAVAAGNDINGNLDAYVADYTTSMVTVLQGNDINTFPTSAAYSVTDGNGNGVGPVAVAEGYDSYSCNYVVATADSDGYVSVLVGDPLNGFGPATTFYTGSDPVAIAATIDSNGYVDFFVADRVDGTVTVLRGDGNDNFTIDPNPLQLAPGLDAVAVNFDGNGNDILAVANALNNTVAVITGDPNGQNFGQPTVYTVGNDPVAVDVNFDSTGNLEIVTANKKDNTVSRLAGTSGDQLRLAATYAVGSQPVGVATFIDANGYGNLDIVSANAGDDSLTTLLGNIPFTTATQQNGVAVRNVPFLQDLNGAKDANGNPIPDEVVLDASGDILFRPGTGTPDQFSPAAVLNPGHPARDMTVFQTGDGWAVAAIDATGNTVSIYTWDGAGFVRTVGFTTTGNLPVRIAAADLTGDGDGRDDLVVANADDTVTIALQTATGQFGDLLTRQVGSAPSDITFAHIGAATGPPDIVVSDQASGDYTVLFNDPSHTFDQEALYRAGAGLFDIDESTGRQTVLSQLLTVGVAAGNFTGQAGDDLVVLNRGTQSFTLLPNQGRGSFVAPLTVNTYATGANPIQIAALTLPGDTRASVAVLMQDATKSQIWVYRNNNQGGFDAPVKFNVGSAAGGFSVTTINGQLALLVGDAFGDVLTLLYVDGSGGLFKPDTSNLNETPMAVGTTADGRQFAIIADQRTNTASLYYRIKGTTQFSSPVLISSTSQLPLLAPGAAQLFYVPTDRSNPYLAFANSLGNDVLLYHYDAATSSFDLLQRIAVGDDPVSITVADVNGDGVPDLLVANKGSNDVSVLIGGYTAKGLWTATPYQRLLSGGLGPVAVAVQSGGANGPDLLITNSDGTVTQLTSIGAGGHGSGFFQDINPQPMNVGVPILMPVFNQSTGQTFVLAANGTVGVLVSGAFRPLPVEGGVAELYAGGSFLVAGLDNGGVEILSTDGAVLASAATGFDQLGALEVLQNDTTGEVDVFVTEAGQDVPMILPFFVSIMTEVQNTQTAEATNVTGFELVLVATLLPDNLSEAVANATVAAVPGEEAFTLFLPNAAGDVGDVGGADTDQEAVVQGTVVGGDASEVPALEQYMLGVADALEQRLQDQQIKDTVEDFLDALKKAMDQFFKDMAAPPPALLDLTDAPPPPPAVSGAAPGDQPAVAAEAVAGEPADLALAAAEIQTTPPAAPAGDVFTCVEMLPSSAAPTWPTNAGNGGAWSTFNAGPMILSTYLAGRLGLEGWRRREENRRKTDLTCPL